MKKNKSLIIILSILAFIVLLVVLSSTIFCLKNVELNFLSNTINLTNQNEQILESAKLKYNQSIFFVNKNAYTKNLEESNPYIKIINIETIFPSTLRINAIERNELLCLKGYEDNAFKSFMIVDDELKVLKLESEFVNTKYNAIKVSFDSQNLNYYDAGKVFESAEHKLVLKKLCSELLAYNNNVNLLKANFEEIIFDENDNLKIKMRSGTEILLKNISTKFTEKFMLGLSTYNRLENKISTKINIYENNDGTVVGYYY